MLNNVLAFTKIHLLGKTGINELRHPGDAKRQKRARSMVLLYVIVGLAIILLMTRMSQVLAEAPMASSLPSFAPVIASILVFILNIFKSGSTIFNLKLFESEVALPVTPADIVLSRFLVLYLVNLAVSMVITVPALIVCGLSLGTTPLYAVLSILGILLIPLIPLTAALLLGTFVYAVSARMKQRKLIALILGMVLMVVAFVLYIRVIFSSNAPLPEILANLLQDNSAAVMNVYPPAELFASGVLGDVLTFLLFAGISLGVFAAAAALVSWKYVPICQAMQAHDAKHNYVMTEQPAQKVSKALFKRDIKRYFSSTPYVMNTMFGYVLMVVASVAILLVGVTSLNDMLGSPVLSTVAPLVLAVLCGMSSTTSGSISIEGKHWWITQTLPVSAKGIFASKLMVNFVVALPFMIISMILLGIAAVSTVLDVVFLILLPFCYLYFMSVLGLFCNIHYPKFYWESETEAVKSGAALLITILIGIISIVAVFAVSVAFWDFRYVVLAVVALAALAAGVVLHRKINKTEIADIR
ncbi:MAG TPA: hypothetical protein O0X97_02240 [Methanocorpusculum sp.]|nr:hypothetical protein [Methanocorpusculum sp.]